MTPARRKRLTLMASILGSAVVFVDGTVVNVALPALRDDLDADLATQQWVVEAYLLTLGALLLVGGSLGDLFGRRRIFLIGLVGFGVTSLLCAVAPNSEFLIAARALQGVAGALLVPSSLAVITAAFRGEERGAAIGSWTAWTGIAILIGPLLGGFLVDEASWRWVFGLNVPLIAVTIALVLHSVEESADPASDHRVDFVGAALATVGLGGPVFALIEQPRYGWDDPVVAVPLVVGLIALAAFVAWERRASHPMLPIDIFRSRNFAWGNVATFTFYAGLSGSFFFIAVFVQQVGGYSALEAGAATTPTTLVTFALSRRFGAMSMRLGPRLFMTAGPLIAGAGLLLITRLDQDVDYLTGLLPGLLVFAFGLAMTVAPLTATVLDAAEDRHAGIASGVNNAVARVAGLVAIALLGAIVSAQFQDALRDRVPEESPVVRQLEDQPLAGAGEVPPAQRAELGPEVEDASVSAFRTGMVACGLLVIAGGLISLAGIQNPRRGVEVPDCCPDGPAAPVQRPEPAGAAA